MAIRLIISGVPVKCDSAQEAAELLRFVGPTPVPRVTIPAAKKPAAKRALQHDANGNGVDKVKAAFDRLSPETRSVLRALRDTHEILYTDELAKRAEVNPHLLKYAVRAIQLFYQGIGVKPDTVMASARDYRGGKPRSKYQLREAGKRWLDAVIKP
jgi:hypothetical protein